MEDGRKRPLLERKSSTVNERPRNDGNGTRPLQDSVSLVSQSVSHLSKHKASALPAHSDSLIQALPGSSSRSEKDSRPAPQGQFEHLIKRHSLKSPLPTNSPKSSEPASSNIVERIGPRPIRPRSAIKRISAAPAHGPYAPRKRLISEGPKSTETSNSRPFLESEGLSAETPQSPRQNPAAYVKATRRCQLQSSAIVQKPQQPSYASGSVIPAPAAGHFVEGKIRLSVETESGTGPPRSRSRMRLFPSLYSRKPVRNENNELLRRQRQLQLQLAAARENDDGRSSPLTSDATVSFPSPTHNSNHHAIYRASSVSSVQANSWIPSLIVDNADPRLSWTAASMASVPRIAAEFPAWARYYYSRQSARNNSPARQTDRNSQYPSSVVSSSGHPSLLITELQWDRKERSSRRLEDAITGRWLFHERHVDASMPHLDRVPAPRFTGLNTQVVLFSVGFILPFAWFIGAFLPLPRYCARRRSIFRLSAPADIEWSGQSIDKLRYTMLENNRWWRTVNRYMSIIGIVIIVGIVVLIVIGARIMS